MIERYIKLDDAKIYCKIYGTENIHSLVLLHGNGEDLHYFDKQIEFFSQTFKVIAIDSRGHGKSTRGTAVLDFKTMAKDVLTVLNVLEIEKTHLIGFSDGGIIALYLALQAQERLYSMILLGVNYTPKGILPRHRVLIWMNYIQLSCFSFFSEKKRKEKEIWGLMMFQPNLTLEEISTIKTPTLLITGENDMVSQKQNDEIQNVIINSKRIVIENADHFLSTKMPETFNEIADCFLQNIVNGK